MIALSLVRELIKLNLGKATISLTAALIQILIAVRDGGPLMRFKYVGNLRISRLNRKQKWRYKHL